MLKRGNCISAINIYKSTNRFLQTSPIHQQQIAKPLLRQQSRRQHIGPFGWILLSIPAATFALGTWQVERKKWKENLLLNMKMQTESDPVPLPENLSDLAKMEYYPIHVKGHFLHDKELYMGPRTLLLHGDAATESSLISKDQDKTQGFLVITPFKLSDRNETILINRGWIPAKKKDPKTREASQIKGDVDVIGIVRLHENKPQFVPSNRPNSNFWFYRNLDEMCKVTGAAPVFLDATNDFQLQGGPVPGQTRISLRNEHLSYIFTWYSLCGITSYMWIKVFLKSK